MDTIVMLTWMRHAGRLRAVALALITVGIVGAAAASAAGIVLADAFHPRQRRSDQWREWHLLASGVFLTATVLGLPVVLWLVRTKIVIAASVTAVVAALVTLATRPLVAWDQLALAAVTVGTNISGYWVAAFGDVRFVFVDNTELPQGDYVPVLLAHLGAPIIGTAALVIVAVALRARGRA